MKKGKFFALFGLVVALGIMVTGCMTMSTSSPSNKTVRVGIVGTTDKQIWEKVAQKVKKDGINLRIVTFSDYNQPNTSLQQGDIDLNAFQHYAFLNEWNKAHHADLVSIGDTTLQPLHVYSNQISSLKDLSNGDKVAIPNDATNEGRALQMFESAGLIKLNKTALPRVKDIVSNPKHLKFSELNASQIARSLNDVTVASINNDAAADANLKPKDAIYVEKLTDQSHQWVNLIASQKNRRNDQVFKKIVKAYQTEDVKHEIDHLYKGTAIAAWEKEK